MAARPDGCESHARPATADMIHYGYGDALWDKRSYTTAEQAIGVWNPPPAPDPSSIHGELARQLREAGDWYAARETVVKGVDQEPGISSLGSISSSA